MSDASSQLSSRQPRNRLPPKGYLNSPTLISLIQKHPCIWDATRYDNRDSNAKAAAWEEIASRFIDTDVQGCKNKWESLKNARNTWKRRHPEPLSGAAATEGPKGPKSSSNYKYSKHMSFLEGAKIEDSRVSTLSEVSSEATDNESLGSEVVTNESSDESDNENTNAMDYTIKHQEEDHEARVNFLKRVGSNMSPVKPMDRDFTSPSSSPVRTPLTVIKNDKNVKLERRDNLEDIFENVKQEKLLQHFGDELNENIADAENIPPKKPVVKKKAKATKPKRSKKIIVSGPESGGEMMDAKISPKRAKISKKEQVQKAHLKRRENQCLLIRQRATEQMQKDSVEKTVKDTPNLQTLLVQELTAKADHVAHFAMSLVDRLRSLPTRKLALCEIALLQTLITFEDEFCTTPDTMVTSTKEKILPKTISLSMQVQIDEVLSASNDERQVGVTKFNLSLKAYDVQCLLPGRWLNDLVIDYYFGLITEANTHIYAVTSHFYPKLLDAGFEGVSEWFRDADIFSYDKVLVPIFKDNNHWCLAVIDVTETKIRYYDSMDGHNLHCGSVLLSYLERKWEQKNDESLPSFLWSFKHMKAGKKIPKQLNSDDCGVFICLFAQREGQGFIPSSPEFRQEDMAHWRKLLVLSLVNGKLMF